MTYDKLIMGLSSLIIKSRNIEAIIWFDVLTYLLIKLKSWETNEHVYNYLHQLQRHERPRGY